MPELIEIESVEDVVLHLQGGGVIKLEMTHARIEAFTQAIGLAIVDVDDARIEVLAFDDESIEQNILPLLPKATIKKKPKLRNSGV